MKIPFFDIKRTNFPYESKFLDALQTCLANGQFVGQFAVEQFETEFAKFINQKHCIACANGTDALELALEALGIGKGDEVVVPAMSWVATASAVVRVGAKPVFADIDPETFQINPEKISKQIGVHTKLIIVVHLYGNVCQMDQILSLANQHQVPVLEDCAQAHGASFRGERVGSLGLMSCFSFYPSKNLGALGDAGAVLTSDEVLAEKIRRLGNHGQLHQRHVHRLAGRNSRLDSLQALFLSIKLPYLMEENDRRNQIAGRYKQVLAQTSFQCMQIRSDVYPVWHQFLIKTNKRAELVRHLSDKGIGTGWHYPKSLDEMDVFADYTPEEVCVHSRSLASSGVSLPIYPSLSTEEQDYVLDVLVDFHKKQNQNY